MAATVASSLIGSAIGKVIVAASALYLSGKHSQCVKVYTRLLDDCDDTTPSATLSLLLCNRAASYLELKMLKHCIEDCDEAISAEPVCLRALIIHGEAMVAKSLRDAAVTIWRRALTIPGDVMIHRHIQSLIDNQLSPTPTPTAAVAAPSQTAATSSSSSSPLNATVTKVEAAAIAASAIGATPAGLDAIPVPADRSSSSSSSSSSSNSNSNGLVFQSSFTPPPARPAQYGVPQISHQQSMNAFSPAEARELMAERKMRGEERTIQLAPSNTPSDLDEKALAAANRLLAQSAMLGVEEKVLLGNVQVNAGKYDDGLRMFNEALRVNPNHSKALIGRGSIHALRSNIDAAITDLSRALELDPTSKDAATRLGQTYAARNDLPNAVRVLSIACEAGLVTRSDSNIFYQRAMIYHRMGDFFGAVSDFTRCVELEPSQKMAWSMLGQCKTSLGDCHEALECLKNALAIDPQFRDAICNQAQCWRDYGNFPKSEECYTRAISLDPTSASMHDLRGLNRYFVGDIRGALSDFETTAKLDRGNRGSHHMRGVALHSMGYYRPAIESYDVLIREDPTHICWYMKQLALFFHHHLDIPFSTYNFDNALEVLWKDGYLKRADPAIIDGEHTPQKPFNSNITDVHHDVKVGVGATADQVKLVKGTSQFGRYFQYDTPGFFGNKRQHRMFGLAIAHMAQIASVSWSKSITVDGLSSSRDRHPHPFGWRDLMDVAVRYRQFSEPNDPVFWIDLLHPKAFAEGFGLQTPMINGQQKVVRYFPYAQRAFNIVKRLMRAQCSLPESYYQHIDDLKSVADLHTLSKSDFWVVTPCHSSSGAPAMEGTRITVQQLPFGHRFTIRTPGTPTRFKQFEQELEHIWSQLTIEMQKSTRDADRLLDLCLTFYFYWTNFGALARGTAACGLVALHALILATGYEVTTPVPKGVQIDWEAILTPTPAEFISGVRSWLKVKPSTLLRDLPDAATTIATLRQLVTCLHLII